jgi:hypothetical protein
MNSTTVNDYQLPAASPCFPAGHTASTATGRDVVYSFTAPSAGQYSFRAWQYVSTGTSNVVAYVASTCEAATPGTPVTVNTCLGAANIQSSTGGEEVNCITLSAGQQVFFYIDESTPGAGGTFYALVEACGTMETEPNNTPAQAGPLACGIQGQVNPATEADFYSLGTPATGSRIFAMADASTAGPSADIDLRVNSATDTIEYDDLDSDIEYGVSGFDPIIAGTMATGVPLFLQVDRFGAAPTGNAIPYRLYSVVQPTSASATPETEPNDTLAGATHAVNNYFSGALAGPAPSTDVDLYAFNATAGDLIMAILDGDPTRSNTPVDARLQLLDSSGATLVDVDGSGSTVSLDNANPPGLFETVPTFPSEGLLFRANTTGLFYVRVVSAVTGATGVGDYLLSITKNCAIGGGLPPCSLTCPANITVSNDPNQCGAIVNYPAPTTSGSCVTVTCVPASGSFFPKGTTTVTCTEGSGASCSFTVTVNDTQPPTITCSPNILVEPDPGMNSAVVNYGSPVASDNCPGVTASYSIPSGSTFPLGTTTVTGTATDAVGNTATCSFTVTVQRRQLSINDVTVMEGDSGSVNAVFTVSMSPASSASTVTVDFVTSNGSATQPGDYSAVNGTLTFAPGQTTRTIIVPVNGDTIPEPSETFFVNLNNPTNADIADDQGQGTIVDNDASGNFQFGAATVTANEGDGHATVTITRTGDTSGGATVRYETSDGTALQKSDYIFGAGVVQFGPGDTSKTVNILLVDDVYVEGSETFNVNLSSPSGNFVLSSPSTVTVTITDNDSSPPTTNPIDDPQFFVRQQYLDFLNREPDPGGLAFWSGKITSCGADPVCINRERVSVSAAFFTSPEFQGTGGTVIRMYKAAFDGQAGQRPTYLEFMRDRGRLIVGPQLAATKLALANDFVTRPEFVAAFPAFFTPAQYVDGLNANTGNSLTPAERDALVNGMIGGTETRATVLIKVADNAAFAQQQNNPAFVLMEYFGYLRRDIDTGGFLFWLSVLNSTGNPSGMVCAFINSGEYQDRFSPIRTHTDSVCAGL